MVKKDENKSCCAPAALCCGSGYEKDIEKSDLKWRNQYYES